MSTLFVSPEVQIPLSELEFSFARSGGPGGQNVNKVSSKAIMRWQVASNTSLPYGVRMRFLTRFANKLTLQGELILTSQKHRDQTCNIDECLEKLKQMLEQVRTPPVPRRPTRPTMASKQRRSDNKSQNSMKKQQRREPRGDY